MCSGQLENLLAHFLSPLLLREECNTAYTGNTSTGTILFALGIFSLVNLGSLTTLMLMHLHYEKGLPLAQEPINIRERNIVIIGVITDLCCIIAALAGTVGPIGFLGLQVWLWFGDAFWDSTQSKHKSWSL